MGQYYIHANIDKLKARQPSGSKLMEHSWVGNRDVQILDTLLRGAWRGDRVVVAGDYFKAEENASIGIDLDVSIYKVYWGIPEVGVPEPSKELVTRWEKKQQSGFYLNYDKKEAVDLSLLPVTEVYNDQDWIISPLTLLIACGNGRGGGDFHEGNPGYEFVGRWAGDHVGIENKLPSEYNLIQPDFREER